MATTRTTNTFQATVPQLADSANIETAFNAYHDSIASTTTGAAVLNRANTFTQAQTFSANATFSGDIAVNGGDITSSASTFNLLNSTVTTLNLGGAGTAITVGASTGTTTINNGLVVAAGTSTKTPLKLTSGTNLTNISAGAFEYDGSIFYATPKVNNTTAGRGLLTTQNILILDSTYTQSVSSTGGTITNEKYALGNKSIYLAASQNYLVELNILVSSTLTIGAGGGNASFSFYLKGQTNTYWYITGNTTVNTAWTTGANTVSEFYSNVGNSTASKTVHSFSTSGSAQTRYCILQWTGIITTNTTAGVFAPTLFLSALGGSGISTAASVTVQSGSYCKVTPLGSSASAVNIGGWA